ncbi:MAG: Nramp family divalent metal transporter [Nitrospirota bacterium]|nr:Nramp family divalent metal transporter [Nitrospirota bacterium]
MKPLKARVSVLALISPGLLVAATGVGAGDLATASFAGSLLGTAVLWAVLWGGFLKFVLTEGLARWQLATGETLLEGAGKRLGPFVGWLFLPYLLLWSFFVGSALMSACGVTLHAIFPVFGNAATGKIVFGIVSSLLGLTLVLAGGFKLFEKVMGFCTALMFFIVLLTAFLLWPGTAEVMQGLFVPSIPDAAGAGITWTVALMGGIGGTVTVLCYGYWIREKKRQGPEDLSLCRIDLALGYAMTILFGVAMVIIGSRVQITGSGADLLVTLAEQLEGPLGPAGRWIFLVGALGAVFSSLLGVWQSVPYLFADAWRLFVVRDTEKGGPIDTTSGPYRWFLWAIALIPMAGLLVSFKEVQKLYAVIGSAFMPLLAVLLLILNGRRDWLGNLSNRRPTVVVLLATLIFFGGMAWAKWIH